LKRTRIITSVLVLACGAALWLILVRHESTAPVQAGDQPPAAAPGAPADSGGRVRICVGDTTGYGWSTNADTRTAIQRAAAHAVDPSGPAPDLTMVFYNPQHDPETIVDRLRHSGRAMGKVIGETSHEGILSPDGYHYSPSGVVGLIAMRNSKLTVGVGGASFDESTPREAAKLALRRAIADAGVTEVTRRPRMIILHVTLPHEEEVLAALAEESGPEVPLIGGTAAGTVDGLSRKKVSNWSIIVNDMVIRSGVGIAVMYSDAEIAWSFGGGFRRTSLSGVITKAQGRLIHEIDGRPAEEVYDQWLGGRVREARELGKNLAAFCSFYPLCRTSGANNQFIRAWPADDPKAPGALRTGSSLGTGDEVFLSEGNWNLLLNHFASVPSKARDSVPDFTANSGLFIYCGGALACIPDAERPFMSTLVNKSMGDLPWIGVFTWGEQGHIPSVGNLHSNLTAGTVLFPGTGPE